ncbi:hypothetical protein DUNSADRAFT_10018, partial [Dunaliella salina]
VEEQQSGGTGDPVTSEDMRADALKMVAKIGLEGRREIEELREEMEGFKTSVSRAMSRAVSVRQSHYNSEDEDEGEDGDKPGADTVSALPPGPALPPPLARPNTYTHVGL